MKKDNSKSIISKLFTKKELKELNFSPEEIADIEAAEQACELIDVMPNTEKEMDSFFDKFEAKFPPSTNPTETYEKFMKLAETDPKFQAQIFSMMFILDTVEEVPPAKAEKISLADIEAEKEIQLSDEKKQKLEEFRKKINGIK